MIYAEIILNLLSFILMRSDKRKAVKKLRRTPEITLLFFTVLGPLGTFFAMNFKFFNGRHKSNKVYFHIVTILGFILHIATFLFFIK